MKPVVSADFDRAYSARITMWGDVRIPSQIKDLISAHSPRSALELGCGIGRFSRYVAQQGLRSVAVDFSSVAIDKAKARAANDDQRAEYLVGDVTKLEGITGPFDVAFDVGCYHCLDASGQQGHAAQQKRLLRAGGTLLIWALDNAPGEVPFSKQAVQGVFADGFKLVNVESSFRRIAPAHWYWLERRAS